MAFGGEVYEGEGWLFAADRGALGAARPARTAVEAVRTHAARNGRTALHAARLYASAVRFDFFLHTAPDCFTPGRWHARALLQGWHGNLSVVRRLGKEIGTLADGRKIQIALWWNRRNFFSKFGGQLRDYLFAEPLQDVRRVLLNECLPYAGV